jgi:hypothetical protein
VDLSALTDDELTVLDGKTTRAANGFCAAWQQRNPPAWAVSMAQDLIEVMEQVRGQMIWRAVTRGKVS